MTASNVASNRSNSPGSSVVQVRSTPGFAEDPYRCPCSCLHGTLPLLRASIPSCQRVADSALTVGRRHRVADTPSTSSGAVAFPVAATAILLGPVQTGVLIVSHRSSPSGTSPPSRRSRVWPLAFEVHCRIRTYLPKLVEPKGLIRGRHRSLDHSLHQATRFLGPANEAFW